MVYSKASINWRDSVTSSHFNRMLTPWTWTKLGLVELRNRVLELLCLAAVRIIRVSLYQQPAVKLDQSHFMALKHEGKRSLDDMIYTQLPRAQRGLLEQLESKGSRSTNLTIGKVRLSFWLVQFARHDLLKHCRVASSVLFYLPKKIKIKIKKMVNLFNIYEAELPLISFIVT